jgi:hypothetical protein
MILAGTSIDARLQKRAPVTLKNGRFLREIVNTDRVERHAYEEMLLSLVVQWKVTGPWPNSVELRKKARSDS